MSPDGSNQTRLPVANGSTADWSPNGEQVVYTSNSYDNNWEIVLMNSDGTNQTRLTNDPATDSSPDWSPDGSRIIFNSARDGDLDLYTMNPDGSNLENLTNNSSYDVAPSWTSFAP